MSRQKIDYYRSELDKNLALQKIAMEDSYTDYKTECNEIKKLRPTTKNGYVKKLTRFVRNETAKELKTTRSPDRIRKGVYYLPEIQLLQKLKADAEFKWLTSSCPFAKK